MYTSLLELCYLIKFAALIFYFAQLCSVAKVRSIACYNLPRSLTRQRSRWKRCSVAEAEDWVSWMRLMAPSTVAMLLSSAHIRIQLRGRILDVFGSCDLDLDSMTFIHELDPYCLEIHRMCEYELFLPQGFRKLSSDRHTDRQVTRGHFRSRDKDGGQTIRSAIVGNSELHGNLMALSFMQSEVRAIEVYNVGFGTLDVFDSCDLDLDPMMTFIYTNFDPYCLEIYRMCKYMYELPKPWLSKVIV